MRSPDFADLKRALRRAARETRAAAVVEGAADDAAATALPQLAGEKGPVAVYWPIGTELDPRPLAGRLAQAGRKLALPRIFEECAPPAFLAWAPDDPLADDLCGVPSPRDDAAVVEPQTIIVPLLAFDRAGGRLGYGGGYYDRAIAAARARGPALIIGYAFAAQQIDAVPREPHDQRLDAVATEREFIVCR
ncbi:MAG: 5-formyltetrahydrofolate cyclo-ligase [Pseudomonadota bacterium]